MSTNLTRFTPDARRILSYASDMALQRHSPYVDVEHVFLGVLQSNDADPLKRVLDGIDRQSLSQQISADLGIVRDTPLEKAAGLTLAVKSMLENAVLQAANMGHSFVNGGHILLAMFQVDSENIQKVLLDSGINESNLRTVVSEHSPIPSTPPAPIPPQQTRARVVFETQRQREQRMSGIPRTQSSGNQWGLYVLAAVTGLVIYLAAFNPDALISFGLVLAAWVFSLTLHEFSHAIVAYWGGDYTVRHKGYLTFNPLRYTHPLLSIVMPLVFLAMGGIGLPGGAVYIETHRLRNKWWRVAVSLAGPASNALLAVVFAAPFWLGIIEPTFIISRWESALAFIVFLQVMAVLLNLLPIPPLDGFNALAEFLPQDIVQQARAIGFISLLLIFYLFRIPQFADPFFETIRNITDFLNVPWNWVVEGFDLFLFWRN